MNTELVNILVRTCNRPNYFAGLVNSINSQTYKNIRVIVSYDDKKDLKYIQSTGWDHIFVKRTGNNNKSSFPVNLYENELLKQVNGGWVMYLDDDDCFTRKRSLQWIMENNNPELLKLWRVQVHNRVVPEDKNWMKLPVKRSHISGIGFMFHSQYKQHVVWDAKKGSDHRVIHKLTETIDGIEWIDRVLTSLQERNTGKRIQGLGRRQDK